MKDQQTHRLFVASILLKGLFATIETLCGVALFFISMDMIQDAVTFLTQSAVVDSPNGATVAFMMDFMRHFSNGTRVFLGLYFLLHGAVKLAVVLGLLSRRLWAFPAGLTAMGLFVVYQLHRYSETHATALLAISALDLVIMWVILREYQVLKRLTKPES